MRTLVKELPEKLGQEVTLYLTLDVLRDQKHLQFILAHDKSGSIQLVVSKKTVEKHEEIGQLLQGSTFIAHGRLVSAEQSKTQGIEVAVSSIEIMSKAEAWPITQESSIDLRFDYRVVDLKFPRQQLMLKLRSAFLQGCREYLEREEFVEIQSPRLMAVASESGAEVFSVDYFEEQAFLSQSPQLYKEAAISSGLDRVYDIGPIFRSEKSGSRHLSEFTGIDLEMAFVFTVEEVMKIEEEMLVHALGKLEPFKEQVKELYGVELTTKPTVKYMTLDEAKEILREKGSLILEKEEDLPDHGEKMLYEILGTDMIFISQYPIAKRPFYHKWDKAKGTTESFDLIFRGIEITSGAIREEKLELLKEQAAEKGITLPSVVIQASSFGTCKHGGLGIGLERVISRLLGISVRECSMFPRTPERLLP